MKQKFWNNLKGVTLLELIIALAILSVLFGGISSLFLLGNSVYGKGTRQNNVQDNIRLAVNYITQQVRYATEVEIINGKDTYDDTDIDDGTDSSMKSNLASAILNNTSIPAYVNYIYYDEDSEGNGYIKLLNRFTVKTYFIGKPGNMKFENDNSSKTLLKFNITGKDKSQEYNINSEITGLNLPLSGIPLGAVKQEVVGLSSGSAIYYKTIDDYISSTQMPIVKIDTSSGKSNDNNNLDLIFDRSIASTYNNLLITDQGDSNLNKAATISKTGTNTIRISIAHGANSGRTIVFQVTFIDDITYQYSVEYDTHSHWIID